MIKLRLNAAHSLLAAQGTKVYHCNATNKPSSYFGLLLFLDNTKTRIKAAHQLQSSPVHFAVPTKNTPRHSVHPNHHGGLHEAILQPSRTTNITCPKTSRSTHATKPTITETETAALSRLNLPLHSAHKTVKTALVQAASFEVFSYNGAHPRFVDVRCAS